MNFVNQQQIDKVHSLGFGTILYFQQVVQRSEKKQHCFLCRKQAFIDGPEVAQTVDDVSRRLGFSTSLSYGT